MQADMDNFEQSIEQARRSLIEAARRLRGEIACYPTPIAGCDDQFNYLLQEKCKIANALAALQSDVFIPTPRQLDRT